MDNCDNCRAGFTCPSNHVKRYPGDTWYSCEFCGIYKASRARCNKCEESE